GKKIGPDPRNFNQRVNLGRNDLLIRTFPNFSLYFLTECSIRGALLLHSFAVKRSINIPAFSHTSLLV
ncbi:hypothetical protein SNB56_16890, partial [Escherichia coli]|nr:hypothetical protein [Escherichia coli]MEA0886661.1 hypothetical protein [Escherichia coli]